MNLYLGMDELKEEMSYLTKTKKGGEGGIAVDSMIEKFKDTFKKKFEDQVQKNPVMIFVWALIGFSVVLGIFLFYWLLTLNIH